MCQLSRDLVKLRPVNIQSHKELKYKPELQRI